jgi:hypothetical protein
MEEEAAAESRRGDLGKRLKHAAAAAGSTNLIKCATLHIHSLLALVPSVCNRDLSLHFGPRAAR